MTKTDRKKPVCCSEHSKVVTWAKLVLLAGAMLTLLKVLNVGFASSSEIEKIEIKVASNKEDIQEIWIRVDKRLDDIQKRINK